MDSLSRRRGVVYTLVLLFVASSVVPMAAVGHAGTHDTAQSQLDGNVVAQQEEKSENTNKKSQGTYKKVPTLIEWLKVTKEKYKKLSPKKQQQIKKDLRALQSGKLSKKQEKERLGRISNLLDYKPPHRALDFITGVSEKQGSLNRTIANVLNQNVGGFTPAKDVPKYGDVKTIQVVIEIARMDVGYTELSRRKKEEVKIGIRNMQTREKSTDDRWKSDFHLIVAPLDVNKKQKQKIRQILISVLGKDGRQPERKNILGISFSSIIEQKLEALKDSLVDAFQYLFNEIYSHTLGTPVPKNSGWHQILGTPTNKPFKALYQHLLIETLYPVMNYFLGLGVLFLGITFTVNPFMSRHRIWDLLTKFVVGLMFYAFSWTAVTLMHGIVSGITNYIVPDPGKVTASAGSLLAFGGAVPVAAALAASLSGIGSIFSLGLVLGLRHFLLTSVFPYIFGPVILIMYLSPWQTVRKWMSVILWQYVNFLTMVIPIALFLKIAVILSWAFGASVGFVFTILGALVFVVGYPAGSIYFFFQMSGTVASGVSSAYGGASSRIHSAKDTFGSWRGSDGPPDTNASGRSTGSSVAEMVDSTTERKRLPEGSAASTDTPTTTAAEVRGLYAEEQSDPMSAAEMKEALSEMPRTDTLKERLDSS
jgi:hypothetical protein